MTHLLLRAILASVLGACAGALGLVISYSLNPAVVFDMYRDLPPRVTSGFYPVERAGPQPFAWTSQRADLELTGVKREAPWECSVRLRGARADVTSLPRVDVAVDGIVMTTVTTTNEFQDVTVTAPARMGRTGLALTLASSNSFVPGPDDRRELGIQVERLECRPAVAGVVLPPAVATRAAAAAGAAFGAALALSGVPLLIALVTALVVILGQSVLLSTGVAPYGAFPGRLGWVAVWVAGLSVAILKLLDVVAAERLRQAARFVVLFSAAVFYLELLGLLHPGKQVIDAVFHAHRLEWVLAGRYYFTQPMPGGVSFPYAIGLYVFASPWSLLTSDYVTLLRVVVCASEVLAGALLYLVIVKTSADRLAGALAVVLFHLVPLPFGILGNANLTNVFGQAVALATLVAAALLQPDRPMRAVGLFALCSLAFLSHVSTFAVLSVTLVALACFYWWRGGPELRGTARSIFIVTVLAAAVSVVAYYGHFGEVYKTALRARTQTAAPAPSAPAEPAAAETRAAQVRTTAPLHVRLANAARLTTVEIGWPILLLATIGLWTLWAHGASPRLGLLLASWAVAYVVFFGVGVVMRVDAPFERYAAEFVGRVNLATYPAAAVLAGRSVAWGCRAGLVPGLASAALVLAAAALGVQQWRGWIG